jgi:hypothetical protein
MASRLEFEAAFCRASEGFVPEDAGVDCEFAPPVERYVTKGVEPYCYAVRMVGPVESDRIDELVDMEIRQANDRGYTAMQWRTFDFPSPPCRDALEHVLVSHGFVIEEEEQLLWACAEGTLSDIQFGPTSGVTIRPVADSADFDAFVIINRRAFGKHEPWFDTQLRKRVLGGDLHSKAILAQVGDALVGSAWLKVFRDFAFLCGGGVVPEHRGVGAYRAMVQHRIAMAQKFGVKYVLAECAASSERILRSMGFRDAGVIRRWWRSLPA